MKYLSRIGRQVYRHLYYTGFSGLMAGLANVVGQSDTKSMEHLFGEGFFNNARFGIWLNALYPLAISIAKKTQHPYLYANIYFMITTTAFTFYHLHRETENTALVMLCTGFAACFTTNRFISQDKKLEDFLIDNKRKYNVLYNLQDLSINYILDQVEYYDIIAFQSTWTYKKSRRSNSRT